MHPTLIRIGSFQLPTFGVLLAGGIVLALYTIVRLGRSEGFDTGRLVDFSTWLLVVGLVGAKVLMIATDWRTYWDHPGGLFSWATLQTAGAYYGGFLALMAVNAFLEPPVPLAPVLAILSGMGFLTLGSTIWGWFYVWGAAFFALALLIVFCNPYGLAVLGLGWFVCLTIGSYHLYRTR